MLLLKNTGLKIRKSLGRFLSLLLIVLVGSGTYAGIVLSAPQIEALADDYLNTHQAMTLKIQSTTGLSAADLSVLKKLDGVETVEGSYSLEAFDQGRVIRVMALESILNSVTLIDGKMPASSGEILADQAHYKVGDTLSLSGNLENLNTTQFTVSGTVNSVFFLSQDYGSASIGNGELDSFIYVEPEVFTLPVFTEVYIRIANPDQLSFLSNDYLNRMTSLKQAVIDLGSTQSLIRDESLRKEALAELDLNQARLMNAKADGQAKLDESRHHLEEGYAQYRKGVAQLAEQKADLDAQVNAQQAQFASAQQQLAQGQDEVDAALKAAGLSRETLSGSISELTQKKTLKQEELKQYPEGSAEYLAASQELQIIETSLSGAVILQQQVLTLDQQQEVLDQGIAAFKTAIEEAQAQISQGNATLAQSKQTLDEGQVAYADALNQFNQQMIDAQAKISEGYAQVDALARTTWYVSDQSSLQGYDILKSGVSVILAISTVFPIFFIAIAVLMTSNSMSRLILEDRTEMGTLTSLGFNDSTITMTYVGYAVGAALIGGLGGFFLGTSFIPSLIFANFPLSIGDLPLHYNGFMAVLIVVVSVVIMAGVSIYRCVRELHERPAVLLRPLAPKSGQRNILERIPLIWNHLSFSWKTVIRNLFRYKKRALMTLIGVAGCTSLLVLGFGLKDSMDGVGNVQYGRILTYNTMVTLQDSVSDLSTQEWQSLADSGLENGLLVTQNAIEIQVSETTYNAYLVVPSTLQEFTRYYHLNDLDQNSLNLQDGAVLTEKLAGKLNLRVGDTLTFTRFDNQSFSVVLSGLAENYVSDYLYLSPQAYQNLTQSSPSYNTVVGISDADQQNAVSSALLNQEGIVNVTFTAQIAAAISENNQSINAIVYMIIVIASALAIVVLYNLTSIHISERQRELATLKVLGFYDREANSYVYREAMILSLISIALGLVLGVYFHGIVIDLIPQPFLDTIQWQSYFYAAGLTFSFSVLMSAVTYFAIQKINMLEAMKSNE